MKRFIGFIATVALLEGVLSPSQAQFRWNPKPLPACRTFPITEIGFNYRISSDQATDQQLYIASDLGFMRNLSTRYALGASNFVGFGDDSEFRGGLKLRVRKWFTNGTSLDISPGILLWDSIWRFSRPGFTGSVDLKFEEWFGLSLIFEYRRAREEMYAHDTGIYLGMKSGSSAGLIGHGVVGLVAGVVGLIFLASFQSN